MIYSYSTIKLYEQCPRKFKFSKIDRLPDSSGEAANRGKLIHAEIETLLKGGLPMFSDEIAYLEDKLTRWVKLKAASEMTIAIDHDWKLVAYSDPTAMFRGVIDLYLEDGPEATIIDFKTGKHRDYSDQVSVYAAVVMACKPHIEYVKTSIEFIDLAKTDNYKLITRSDLRVLQLELKNRIQALEKDKIHAANPSYLCNYCNYRKNNGGPCKW
jgi:CRISPR/Cas system-associated exonuclease Cas4 (RecB family)